MGCREEEWDDALRKDMSDETRKVADRKCLESFFRLYRFHAIDGSTFTMHDVFPETMPRGDGRLLRAEVAFLCVFPSVDSRKHGRMLLRKGQRFLHPCARIVLSPCQNRCRPLIRSMFGIDVVYADDAVVVVDKPAGLLSVPGIGDENGIARKSG